MRILSRDELNEQRKNYMGVLRTFNKLAKGFEDGTFKGENLRDMNSILQTRFLSFILSELVQMSQILRAMEDQIGIDFLTNTEDLSDDEFDTVFNTQNTVEEAKKNLRNSEENIVVKDADILSTNTEEVLEAIAKLDENGLDDARRLLNEIYMRTPPADDEESN